jgi:O-antigen/teichoic acid export membrane protein
MASLSRSVFEGTAILSISGIAVRALSLLTTPMLTALLPPAAYGASAYVQTLASIGAVVALMGIDMGYARYYLDNEDGQSQGVERFCWCVALGNAIAVALVLYTAWQLAVAKYFGVSPNLGWVLAASVVFSVVGSMASTRIRLRGGYRRIAVAIFVSGLCTAMITLALARLWRQDVWALLIGAIAGATVSLLMLGVPGFGTLLTHASLGRDRRREIVLLGLAGAVIAPMYWVVSSSDRWFLGYFRDESQVGIYSVAYSLASVSLIISGAITQVWFPEATKVHQRSPQTAARELGKIWERLVVGLAVAWLMVASIGGDLLRLLTHENYHSGAVIIPWLAGGIFFYSVTSLANTGLWIAGKMKWSAYFWILGAIFNFLLNMFLIPLGGMLGAAISQCISYLSIAVAVGLISWRLYPLDVRWLRLGIVGLGGTLAGTVLSIPWHANPFVSLAIKSPFVVIVSWTIAWLIAADWCNRLLRLLPMPFRGEWVR